jgi:hypothetical protein
MRFGEEVQPGTVEWELSQCRLRAKQHEDDREWAEIQRRVKRGQGLENAAGGISGSLQGPVRDS